MCPISFLYVRSVAAYSAKIVRWWNKLSARLPVRWPWAETRKNSHVHHPYFVWLTPPSVLFTGLVVSIFFVVW